VCLLSQGVQARSGDLIIDLLPCPRSGRFGITVRGGSETLVLLSTESKWREEGTVK